MTLEIGKAVRVTKKGGPQGLNPLTLTVFIKHSTGMLSSQLRFVIARQQNGENAAPVSPQPRRSGLGS